VVKILQIGVFNLIFTMTGIHGTAQPERTQYPFILSNRTYFEANFCYIGYHFSNLQMEQGYFAESIHVPHAAVRLVLYGYHFNKYLSVQISYMRPVLWVQYKNINGDHSNHSVPTNVAGLTIKAQSEIKEKLSIYGEAGLGIITRSGFSINQVPVLKNANYPSLLVSGGLTYRLKDKLNLVISTGWSPADGKIHQPATSFFTAGAIYNVRRISAERIAENKNSGFIFPENLVQVSYTTNVFGYVVNNFFANRFFPIFWGGDVQVRNGISFYYQHNIFHGKKVFSLDWGTSFSYWESKIKKERFFTLSLYPLLRFTAFHLKKADLYFDYSVAGPTFISKIKIDDTGIGKKFTFQDFMGMGMYSGKQRRINAEMRIGHYSNGDLFPDNNGVKVPLSFIMGYTF
jgi:hypothetical protein